MKNKPTHSIVIPVYENQNKLESIINKLIEISEEYHINSKEIFLIDENTTGLYNYLNSLDR